MDLYDVLFVAAIGLVFGTLAQLTSGYSRGGWIVHMGLGFLGASVGVAIARSFKVPLIFVITITGREYPIIWAVIGAVFFLAAIGFMVSPSRR